MTHERTANETFEAKDLSHLGSENHGSRNSEDIDLARPVGPRRIYASHGEQAVAVLAGYGKTKT
jgi:hypothetical protein